MLCFLRPYPDYLPQWAIPKKVSPTDALVEAGGDYLIDVRAKLMNSRQRFSQPLYYQYDSHWNSIGGWIGFDAYMELLAAQQPIHRLDAKAMEIGEPHERVVGGIANFFGLAERARDATYPVSFHDAPGVKVEYYDYETQRLMKKLSNYVEIQKPGTPLYVKSPQALNQKRVLWLRDSFGNAMSPYMALTFSDVLQVDYRKISPLKFQEMVSQFNPDYVFFTIVERHARDRFFERYLPEHETFFTRKYGFRE